MKRLTIELKPTHMYTQSAYGAVSNAPRTKTYTGKDVVQTSLGSGTFITFQVDGSLIAYALHEVIGYSIENVL